MYSNSRVPQTLPLQNQSIINNHQAINFYPNDTSMIINNNPNNVFYSQQLQQQQRTNTHIISAPQPPHSNQHFAINQLPIQQSQQIAHQSTSVGAISHQHQSPYQGSFNNPNSRQLTINQQVYANKSILGIPPDHSNHMFNSQLIAHQHHHNVPTATSPIHNQPQGNSHCNYHQHQTSLITLTNGTSNNSHNQAVINNRQTNNRSTSNNKTRVIQNCQSIRSNYSLIKQAMNNAINEPPRFSIKQEISTTNNVNNNNNNTSSDNAYKQKLKICIDANKRNINQRLNTNNNSLHNGTKNNLKLNINNNNNNNNNCNINNNLNENTSNSSTVINNNQQQQYHHQNKQLIVIKPADDLDFDNQKSQSQKRSHSNAELNNVNSINENSSKKLNSSLSSLSSNSSSIHEPDLILCKNDSSNCSLSHETIAQNSIVKLGGCLVEKKIIKTVDERKSDKDNEQLNENLIKINLEVFYCKLCMLVLYNENILKAHIEKEEHKNKIAVEAPKSSNSSIDVNNNNL